VLTHWCRAGARFARSPAHDDFLPRDWNVVGRGELTACRRESRTRTKPVASRACRPARASTHGDRPVLTHSRKDSNLQGCSEPAWAFSPLSDPRIWLRSMGQTCRKCRQIARGAYLGDTTARCRSSNSTDADLRVEAARFRGYPSGADAGGHERTKTACTVDGHHWRPACAV
jgi:hypothetical protein